MLQFFRAGRDIQERQARIEGGLVATQIAMLEELSGKQVEDPEAFLLRAARRDFNRRRPREVDFFLAGGLETLDDLREEDTYYCGLCGHVPIARPCIHHPGAK